MKNTLDAVPIHLDQSKKTEFRDTWLEDSQSELQRKKKYPLPLNVQRARDV